MYIIKQTNELFYFHFCNFLGKQTEGKRKLRGRERGTGVIYSLPETVWRRSKSMMWSSWSFWTNSTTFRSDNRMLDFACCALSNCLCNSSNSSSIFFFFWLWSLSPRDHTETWDRDLFNYNYWFSLYNNGVDISTQIREWEKSNGLRCYVLGLVSKISLTQ